MLCSIHGCRDGKLAEGGESQSLDLKEIGKMLLPSLPDYLNVLLLWGKSHNHFLHFI